MQPNYSGTIQFQKIIVAVIAGSQYLLGSPSFEMNMLYRNTIKDQKYSVLNIREEHKYI